MSLNDDELSVIFIHIYLMAMFNYLLIDFLTASAKKINVNGTPRTTNICRLAKNAVYYCLF